jgi:SAM-dependent methyltransferase
MSIRKQMDAIYRQTPLEQIPWQMDAPPEILVDLIADGTLRPCRALDLGCGAGTSSIYLAGQGFDVTGVDISAAAIALAEKRAQRAGATCRFAAADLTGEVDGIGGGFELAFEWEVLHHVLPEQRQAYLDNVDRLLAPGARYLSVCFSEESPAFGGQGKLRRTPMGTELYFSSADELRALFSMRFEILGLDTVEVPGKQAPHLAIRALLVKP